MLWDQVSRYFWWLPQLNERRVVVSINAIYLVNFRKFQWVGNLWYYDVLKLTTIWWKTHLSRWNLLHSFFPIRFKSWSVEFFAWWRFRLWHIAVVRLVRNKMLVVLNDPFSYLTKDRALAMYSPFHNETSNARWGCSGCSRAYYLNGRFFGYLGAAIER